VNLYLSGTNLGPFYQKVTTLLSGKQSHSEVDKAHRIAVWDSIAYANYIPILLDYPRSPVEA
jgi:hypothetical protein